MSDPVTLSLGLILAFVVQTAVIAFWAGRMTQRLTAVERHADERQGLNDKVTTLTVEMAHANASLDKLGHHMEGVQRQLANLATGRANATGTL